MSGRTTTRILLAADFPLYVLPGFESEACGHHATWLPPLAQQLEPLIPNGWELHWLTFHKQVHARLCLEMWGQTFHLLPRQKLAVEMFSGFRRERRLIQEVASELEIDLYHGWGTEQGYGYGAVDFAGISVLSMQGILQRYCQVTRMPWLARLQAWHERQVLARVHHLTVESPWGQEQLASLAPQADVSLLEYGAASACFDVSRGPTATPLALFVGSPNRLKGIDTLLSAFASPALRRVQLVVLGAASDSWRARAPHVHFAGHVSPDEVRQWMTKAWCLVHPTLADTSPNCVKEARIIGLPVVTTPEGGQTQYVVHQESGWLHAPGDIDGLIEGVSKVTEHVATSLEMGKSGQTECRLALHPHRTATQVLDIYRKLLEVPCLADMQSP